MIYNCLIYSKIETTELNFNWKYNFNWKHSC